MSSEKTTAYRLTDRPNVLGPGSVCRSAASTKAAVPRNRKCIQKSREPGDRRGAGAAESEGVLRRMEWRILGAAGRVRPAAWFGLEWFTIALVARFGHLYAGDQRFQLGWGGAIVVGLGLSALSMVVWWIGAGRR